MIQTMFIQFIEEFKARRTNSVKRSVDEMTYYYLSENGHNLMVITVKSNEHITEENVSKQIIRNKLQIKELTFTYI